jgi:predicted ArsR family transcriptional regulator
MGRRSATGTLIELLGRLHARDGATVTDLARSAELTARTVRARLADLERSGLVERAVIDGDERWFRSSRMARHGVLLPASTARRALQLLERLPREGRCAHVVEELTRALHDAPNAARDAVHPPRWSAATVAALDQLHDALDERFALRITMRDAASPSRSFVASVRALSLEAPLTLDAWDHELRQRCVLPLASV